MKPRERLLSYGVDSLALEDLLAIIIGVGTRDLNVFSIANDIVNKYQCDELINLTYEELIKIRGIKKAKATRIMASLELARRIFAYIPKNISLKDPEKIYNYLKSYYLGKEYEEFLVLFVNEKLQLIKKIVMNKGDSSQVMVDYKEVFRQAIRLNASAIILVHNHPSNILKPSLEDKILTKEIAVFGSKLQINLIDHLIIGKETYYSFMENDMLKMEE